MSLFILPLLSHDQNVPDSLSLPSRDRENDKRRDGGAAAAQNKRVPEIKFDVPEKDSFSGSYSVSDSVDTDSSTDVEGKGEADDDDDEEEDEEEYFDPNDGEPRWLGRVWVPHERFSTDFDFGSTKSYEAKLGYNFGKFLTGRRDLDRVCNMWHILFLVRRH